jgi:hypothetical protein
LTVSLLKRAAQGIFTSSRLRGALGMTTIKVVDAAQAIAELEAATGMELR